jgi:hypothetical protein
VIVKAYVELGRLKTILANIHPDIVKLRERSIGITETRQKDYGK